MVKVWAINVLMGKKLGYTLMGKSSTIESNAKKSLGETANNLINVVNLNGMKTAVIQLLFLIIPFSNLNINVSIIHACSFASNI